MLFDLSLLFLKCEMLILDYLFIRGESKRRQFYVICFEANLYPHEEPGSLQLSFQRAVNGNLYLAIHIMFITVLSGQLN